MKELAFPAKAGTHRAAAPEFLSHGNVLETLECWCPGEMGPGLRRGEGRTGSRGFRHVLSACAASRSRSVSDQDGPLPDHLLQSVKRTVHSPPLPLSQSLREATRAASRSLREAAPMCLPSSVDASAAHIAGPARMMTLQPL